VSAIAVEDLLEAARGVLRPLEVISPAEFAQRHRFVVGGPFAGKWDNANGPYLVDIMNAVQEALETGKHLVCIKGAQQGVTDALGVNAVAWLLTYFGGPILYLTSKDDTASKLVRDRWDNVLESCEPLAKKHLAGKIHGELILQKRFTDASLRLAGSRSLLNFLSDPYAVVVFDELDSCQDRMADGSDPIAIIAERLTAMAEGRPVLIIAFAHPTTKARGAAKLYYQESDQRRAHVECPHCGRWFAPLWKDVKVFAPEGVPESEAQFDPAAYALVASCCGAILSETDRLRMIAKVEQRSTLAPELAKTKDWIGVHVWHLFLRKGGQVARLAKKHVAGLEDEGKAVVFTNKVCGDAFELDEEENPDEDAWRSCVTLPRFTGDPASYSRGELPADVTLLTAGTDHNMDSLHWTVWGWGLLPTADGARVRCGWLIDWGEVRREPPQKTLDAADLLPFAQHIYTRGWRRADGKLLQVVTAGHDSGWLPDGVHEFADARAGRAVSIKGGNDDLTSRNPILRWGKKPKRVVKGCEIPWRDDRIAIVNTFLAKRVFFGLVRRRFTLARKGAPLERDRWRLHLPVDVDDEVLEHLSSERLARRRKKVVWEVLPGAQNHFLDASLYAFALSEQASKLVEGRAAPVRAGAAAPQPQAREDDDEGRRSWRIGR
jgi:phage terminase large subunit GpA-like protein